MFAVPNSATVYLINRKGEVVHEWKGNYGVLWGYLMDDGSLYRWGNPSNYRRGDSTDQKLYHQHDVRWFEKEKRGAGNLTIFNNDIPDRNSMNYSSVIEIVPPLDGKGNYIPEKGKAFGPEEPVWIYTAPDSVSFYSSFVSGAHRMNNGNTFINEGAKGRILRGN
jgi:hypothetical protein